MTMKKLLLEIFTALVRYYGAKKAAKMFKKLLDYINLQFFTFDFPNKRIDNQTNPSNNRPA